MFGYIRFVPVEVVNPNLEKREVVNKRTDYTVDDYIVFSSACKAYCTQYFDKGNARVAVDYAHSRLLMVLKGVLVANGVEVALDEESLLSFLSILEMTLPDVAKCCDVYELQKIKEVSKYWSISSIADARGIIALYDRVSKVLLNYIKSTADIEEIKNPYSMEVIDAASELNTAYEDVLIEKGFGGVVEMCRMFGQKNILQMLHNPSMQFNIQTDNRIDYICSIMK